MAHTKTEVIGFCGAVIDFVETNRDALVSRGMNIDQLLVGLNADADAATGAGSEPGSMPTPMRQPEPGASTSL
ncbi:MAG: hypothetical protein HZC28_19605 [Spirochaetes bacterium]|nr:hypothetical protein [Spirochaetota bacterium]